MRGRAAAAAITAVLAIAGPAVVGCTDDDGAGPDATAAVTPSGPIRAPEVFRHAAATSPDGWAWVGATDDFLVGLGGSPDGAGSYGQIVDLATGEVREIERPPDVDGRPTEATAAAFRQDDVIVTGFLPPVGGYPPGTDRAPDVEAVSFRLDPGDGSWAVIDGPGVALGIGRFARLDLVGPEGVVGTFAREYATGTERARLDGDRWELLDSRHRTSVLPSHPACATTDDLWEAVRGDDGNWGGIVATSFDDEVERPIVVPDLRWPSGDGPVIGCATDVVVVGEMEGIESVAVLAATTDHGVTWADLTGRLPEGRVILGDVVAGGDQGVVMRAHLVESSDDGEGDEVTSDASLVISPEGEVVRLDVEEASTPVVWRGRTGELLALEPTADGDVEVRAVEVP